MKTKYWIAVFAVLVLIFAGLSWWLMSPGVAARAEIYVDGNLVRTVDLSVDQEFTVNGHNTVTVSGGKIAVTWADCPDGYCMARGYCAGGMDIVCLPNQMVITFVGRQEVDAAVG